MHKPAVIIALLSGLAAAPTSSFAQSANPDVIAVELSNFKFSPSELTLQHGHAYRLHLVNEAGGAHDFSAPEFFAASVIAPADRGSVVDGKVKLAGHQTVDVTLTPQRVGSYDLHCSHFLHSGMGMKGLITVQ